MCERKPWTQLVLNNNWKFSSLPFSMPSVQVTVETGEEGVKKGVCGKPCLERCKGVFLPG